MTFDLSRLRAPAAVVGDADADSRVHSARILVVCTGNVCRSPLAALLLRSRLRGLDVDVSSAGTHALVGYAMTPETVDLAVARGIARTDAEAHRAVWLQPSHLEGADLVLTMDREQRRHVVQLAPALTRRVFTIREFARLAASLDAPATSLSALVAQVAGRRGQVEPPLHPTDDDVVDPFGRSIATYKRSAAQLDPAIREVVRRVRGAVRPG